MYRLPLESDRKPPDGLWSRLSYERRLALLSLLAGLPGAVVALVLLWTGDFSAKLQWTLTLFIVLFGAGFTAALRQRVVFPLRTLANLLEALRVGDYSLRARVGTERIDALSEVLWEINELRDALTRERLGAVEAEALLRRVMEEIDVAVFTFGADRRLRLVNRSGARVLGRAPEELLGRSAVDLGLAACLEGAAERTFQAVFPGGEGRWGMRRGSFREKGLPHHLLVLNDLSQTLREEERQAWRRLIRVIGHELNNSLAPIRSMTATLSALLAREPRPADWEQDMESGLKVIGHRSESLIRFMAAYSRLARLPPPEKKPLAVAPLVRRVAALETRLGVEVEGGPEVELEADGAQLEQLLINLVQNAVDAALETGGGVRVGWRVEGDVLARAGAGGSRGRASVASGESQLLIRVEDDGPGLSNRENLFVPFYSTKPEGSGIGLVLSRQIAEAHGGSLVLDNRPRARGSEARVRLPV